MGFRKELIIPKTVEQLIDDRDLIIKNLTDMDRLKNKTQKLCEEVNHYIFPVQQFRGYHGIESLTRDVDRRMWRLTLDMTGFTRYMDKKARKEFTDSLESNPPVFSIDNVRTTLLSSYNEAETYMKRGLVELFKSLSGNYKANDAFKVGKKLILQRWFTVFCGDLSLNYHSEPEMNDLDRIVRVLDGADYKEGAFSAAMRKVASTHEYEDEYFKIKAFKNGNAHLWFKEQKTIDQINDVIAQWYGEGKLGDNK